MAQVSFGFCDSQGFTWTWTKASERGLRAASSTLAIFRCSINAKAYRSASHRASVRAELNHLEPSRRLTGSSSQEIGSLIEFCLTGCLIWIAPNQGLGLLHQCMADQQVPPVHSQIFALEVRQLALGNLDGLSQIRPGCVELPHFVTGHC